MDGIRGRHTALGHVNEPGSHASETALQHAAPQSAVQRAAAAPDAAVPITSDGELQAAAARARTAIQSGTQPPPFSKELRLANGGGPGRGSDGDGDHDGGRDGHAAAPPLTLGRGNRLGAQFRPNVAKFTGGASDAWLNGQAAAAAQQHNSGVKSRDEQPEEKKKSEGGISGVAVASSGSAGTVT